MSNEKVRLLLLIKEELLQYLQRRFASGAFAELLRNKEQNKQLIDYQKHLRHGIGKNTSFQLEIVQEYEKIEKKVKEEFDVKIDFDYQFENEIIKNASDLYKEFNLINKSISSQSGVFTKKDESKKIFFYDYFIDIIKTIYTSVRLGDKIGKLDYKEVINFLNSIPFNDIIIPVAVIHCIFPEIILNQKKYGVERKIDWKEQDDSLEFIFSNKIKDDKIKKEGFELKMCKEIKKEGFGLKMCKEIKKLYDNTIVIEVQEKSCTNEFIIIIKIMKNGKESINN